MLHTKKIGDWNRGTTFPSAGYFFMSIGMKTAMFCLACYNEIRYSIISFFSINVMYLFKWLKISSNFVFHKKSMLENISVHSFIRMIFWASYMPIFMSKKSSSSPIEVVLSRIKFRITNMRAKNSFSAFRMSKFFFTVFANRFHELNIA